MRALRLLAVPLIAVFLLAVPAPAPAQFTIGFTVGAPPPMMPVYNTIPPAPYPNYIWQPGYWAWGPAGYYWVPGTWVMPPQTGMLWTPGYWGWNNGGYGWNAGYWAPQVGFYGGIDYGFGYPGTGFYGGQWTPSGFSYNTAVWPVTQGTVTNVYVNRTVINRTVIINRTSYNGGTGGVHMVPNAQQRQVLVMHHVAATPLQVQHAREAAQDRNLLASVNKGHPQIATVAKPLTAPPPHSAPITDTDRAAAKPLEHKAPAMAPEHKAPATAPEHKAPAMAPQHKPATAPEHKAPATATEHKPATAPQHKPPAMAPEHKTPPAGAEHKTPAPHEDKKPPSA